MRSCREKNLIQKDPFLLLHLLFSQIVIVVPFFFSLKSFPNVFLSFSGKTFLSSGLLRWSRPREKREGGFLYGQAARKRFLRQE